ncbi:hypothetical protein NDR87_09050 [Nocardia sp. CDC159]|uniref:Uncharacterized protein n=1 Tax=Nocardia pulmonis TaxID=2951408 RepID=A0A9X2E4E3_9NOCA|nr:MULTISPECIES: hypothetical protein [Nocardia]MCM6773614.1 hypothetical protein [Nocardia pulmonis]MCM6786501.1 hypothetical protein [Nocardia sp. CDC159]
MSRSRYHRDSLAEYVADSFLHQDLLHALATLPRSERDLVDHMIEQEPADDSSPERDDRLLRRILTRVRLDPVQEARLLAYLRDRRIEKPGTCPVCLRELPPREPGKGGRPRKYCRTSSASAGPTTSGP